MTFQLDTTGAILLPQSSAENPFGKWASDATQWDDLSPFTQGYIEALFAELHQTPVVQECGRGGWNVGFFDLAPETLARIIADCERMRQVFGWLGPKDADGAPVEWFQEEGRSAWKYRQNGDLPNFPPLTVQLGDDGKVLFAERG